jgi:hypothetical protein
MERLFKEAELDGKLKELKLNVQLLSLLCKRDDVYDILFDDICKDLDFLIEKVEDYKKLSKR